MPFSVTEKGVSSFDSPWLPFLRPFTVGLPRRSHSAHIDEAASTCIDWLADFQQSREDGWCRDTVDPRGSG